MTSALHRLGQAAYGLAFGNSNAPNPLEIGATPANLGQAIREKGKDIFQYKFQEGSHWYAPFEYAIKLGDKGSVRALIELGAAKDSPIVHRYIDHLQEGVPADLEMLRLLLDHTDGYKAFAQDVLRDALVKMNCFQEVHWEVAEMLLQRGARIDVQPTPFDVLKPPYGGGVKSLQRLAQYLNLEKKYHPTTTSGLSFEEFRGLMEVFPKNNVLASGTPFFSQAISGAAADPTLLASLPADERERFVRDTAALSESMLANRVAITGKLFTHHALFLVLFKEGNFRDLFSPQQLEQVGAIILALQQANSRSETAHAANQGRLAVRLIQIFTENRS